jgi:hypothetical protein
MKIKPALLIVLLLLSSLVPGWGQPSTTDAGSAKWEPDIQAFEEGDRVQSPPSKGVLFVGSSSIRLWETLAEDFPQAPVIRRGFGGCEMADVLFYADRIILRYRPRLVFVYAGDNDLANKKTPDQVLNDLKQLVTKVHEALPETRIIFIAVKPSPSRWNLVEKVRAVNEGAKKLTMEDGKFFFADTFTPMLGEDGTPRKELFKEDMLHLNRQGYFLWREILKPFVDP